MPVAEQPTKALLASAALHGIFTRHQIVLNDLGGQGVYTYDLAGNLIEVAKNGTPVAQYDYDQNGNRIGGRTAQGVISANYDAQDRLVTSNGTTYLYTLNGELTAKIENRQTTQYSYDLLGNLRHVNLANGTNIDYLIDARSRRVGKKVNGVLVQGFLYQDQLKPIAELDGTGTRVCAAAT